MPHDPQSKYDTMRTHILIYGGSDMAERMGRIKGFSKRNIDEVPVRSGVYNLLNVQGDITYTGSAGAGRLRERLMEHLRDQDIPGATHFQIRPTSSTKEARRVENDLIKRTQPRHNQRGK